MLCGLYSSQAQNKTTTTTKKVAKMLWNAHPWLCCPTNFISGLTLSEEKAPGLCEEQERDMFWTIFKRHLRTIQEAIKEEGKVTRILTWYGKCWEGYFKFYHVELWRLHVASRDGHFAAVYHTGLSAQPNASRDSTEKLTVAQSKNMRKLDASLTYIQPGDARNLEWQYSGPEAFSLMAIL